MNSCGALEHRNSCNFNASGVQGGTKALSMRTRIGVRCPAVETCPSCPDYSLEPPVPGRIIRNMLGWSLQEETDKSGVWPSRGESFFFLCRSWRLGQEGVVPHSVGGSL